MLPGDLRGHSGEYDRPLHPKGERCDHPAAGRSTDAELCDTAAGLANRAVQPAV